MAKTTYDPKQTSPLGQEQRLRTQFGQPQGKLKRWLVPGLSSDCLPGKAGLNSGRIIELLAKGLQTDWMYDRTLASAYTVAGGAGMILVEGQLKGSIAGFKDRDTIFEFYGGGKWRQAEHKYHYHYAYMPRAKVVQEGGRTMLYVEGIDEPVEVRPA